MDDLKTLYKALADFTAPICAGCAARVCTRPLRCCSPEYCYMAAEYAASEGEEIPPVTGHPILPYMGKTGCVIPPHLRPLCTRHLCDVNGIGFIREDKPGTAMGRGGIDESATNRYFELTDKIDALEFAKFPL